jgi:excisionase family DNA binding protein
MASPTHEEQPDELLTIEAAASRINVAPLDLRRLLQAGRLPAIKTGASQWRISAAALKKFIERRDAPKRLRRSSKEPRPAESERENDFHS